MSGAARSRARTPTSTSPTCTRRACRDYQATAGNRGATPPRRDDGELTRITTLSLWDSLDDIRAFAGEDIEKARYYPEDDRFLVEREDVVEHWTVAGGEL